MLKIAVAGLFVSLSSSACLSSDEVEILPGEASVMLHGPWIQGSSSEARLEWPNFYRCNFDDWFCDDHSLTMTVLSVECHGCELLPGIEGNSSLDGARVRAVATTDGPISIEADLRFDATGEIRRVSGSTMGDHEVALEAQCRLIDTAALAEYSEDSDFLPDSLFRECGATRLPTDTVVIYPAIRTFRDDVRFPFCKKAGLDACRGSWNEEFRLRSELAIEPAPVHWGFNTVLPSQYFAVLPDLGSTQTISLTVPLASGEVSTTTVAIPPAM